MALADWGTGRSLRSTRDRDRGVRDASTAPLPGDTLLSRLIETNIIPRLIGAHDHDLSPMIAEGALPEGDRARCIEEFTETALASNADLSSVYFEHLMRLGVPVDVLFYGILVPAARRLGELWDSDLRDFTEVARGMDHIQQIVLSHCSVFAEAQRSTNAPRRILLMPVPDEGHRFGLLLVRAQFWREGWDVSCDIPVTIDDLARAVRTSWFDAVGLSASSVRDPGALTRAIARVRKVSQNRDLVVLVGGQAFAADPGLVTACGADVTAADGREAVARMRTLLDHRLSASA